MFVFLPSYPLFTFRSLVVKHAALQCDFGVYNGVGLNVPWGGYFNKRELPQTAVYLPRWFFTCGLIIRQQDTAEPPWATGSGIWRKLSPSKCTRQIASITIKNWITGWNNSRVLIGLPIMAYEPLYHALQIIMVTESISCFGFTK